MAAVGGHLPTERPGKWVIKGGLFKRFEADMEHNLQRNLVNHGGMFTE